ncbi:MAG TPA: YafY family protein [Halanaerobiales bacterium]|nr:YafY family protein [Halanaerobiales bacterium]
MTQKNRVYRILEMIDLLRNRHRKWKVRELAEHFGVTSRTIYRDLDKMEEMRIPIYSDEKEHTFSILEDFYFKAPEMNEREALALLLVGQAFREEIFPYQEELDTAISKILNSLPESLKRVIDSSGGIVYQYGGFVDLKCYKEYIFKIEEAIKNRKILSINYYSLSSEHSSMRKVAPYSIAYKNGACYLIAYCHNRREIRLFRVDRIENLEISDEIYREDRDFNIDEYLKNTWGIERSDREFRVVLVFKGKAARLVEEMVWHPSQQIIKMKNGGLRFEVTTGSMTEIKSWILGYGSEVEVIRPPELKEEIRKEIEKMREIYQ